MDPHAAYAKADRCLFRCVNTVMKYSNLMMQKLIGVRVQVSTLNWSCISDITI